MKLTFSYFVRHRHIFLESPRKQCLGEGTEPRSSYRMRSFGLLLISFAAVLVISSSESEISSEKSNVLPDVAARWKLFFEKSFDKFLVSMKTNMENIYYYGNWTDSKDSAAPANPFTVVQYCLHPMTIETFNVISKAHSSVANAGHQYIFLYWIPESNPYSRSLYSMDMLQDYFYPDNLIVVDMDTLQHTFGSRSAQLIQHYKASVNSTYSRSVFIDALALYAHQHIQARSNARTETPSSESTSESTAESTIDSISQYGYTWFVDSSVRWAGDLSKVLARWDDDAGVSIANPFAAFTAPAATKATDRSSSKLIDYAAAGCIRSSDLLHWSKEKESNTVSYTNSLNPLQLALNSFTTAMKKYQRWLHFLLLRIRSIVTFGMMKPKSMHRESDFQPGDEIQSNDRNRYPLESDSDRSTAGSSDEHGGRPPESDELVLCMSELSRYSPRMFELLAAELLSTSADDDDNLSPLFTAASVAAKRNARTLDLLDLGLTDGLLSADFAPSLFHVQVSSEEENGSPSIDGTGIEEQDGLASEVNQVDSDSSSVTAEEEESSKDRIDKDSETSADTEIESAPSNEWPFLPEPLTEAFQRLSERFINPAVDQDALNWQNELFKNISASIDMFSVGGKNTDLQSAKLVIIEKLTHLYMSNRQTALRDYLKATDRFSYSTTKLEAQFPRMFASRPGILFRNVTNA